ncbi:MAG: hypothetical protein COV59_01040 [Candidatus Magasanikbacteria bacterium CG11_big_fil_rev_8_21_14_0_20_39_34]|uniref:Kazal-like domain-containing protein n=1 Tax=Candidatus Magasanikbacteria bacterium CG11_big_fil_rev_8_21_14_0_20_39_34 TaxID=1974653 RepID=A0A2H0N8F8_9BACT|nr:MAG: hypothetical protein COV59_01040 [Candidatus Magasanikbacteria bacterium CG11_big_fil_rev_8_21_14_0_20_39_34]
MKRIFRSSWFLVLPLFFGGMLLISGCGNQTETQPSPQKVSKQTVIKQPDQEQTPLQKALEYCSDQGYDISFVVDEKNQETHAFCIFDDNKACEVLAYQEGICTQDNGSGWLSEDDTLDGQRAYRYCDTTTKPVCGEDGKTYVSECIAQAEGIHVKQEGPCPSDENGAVVYLDPIYKRTPTKKISSGNTGSSGKISPSSPAPATANTESSKIEITDTPQKLDDWFQVLVSVSEYERKTDNTLFIEECVYNKKYYYYKASSQNGFSVLYNDKGTALCFPNNNVNNSCPSFFDVLDRANICKKLWP